MKAWEIVGYTFDAENLCADVCARKVALAGTLGAGSATCWGDAGSTEDILSEWALLIGLDRRDERSFDSGEFPKVIFASAVVHSERCDRCGEYLIEHDE